MLHLLAESDDWSGIAQFILFLLFAGGGWVVNAIKKRNEAKQVFETQRQLRNLDAVLEQARERRPHPAAEEVPADWKPEVVQEGPAMRLVEESRPEAKPVEPPSPAFSNAERGFMWREILLPPLALREPR